jgi:tape measure domain-containing protein
MTAGNDGLEVEIGISLQRLTQQLARAEGRLTKTAKKWERDFQKANTKAGASFKSVDRGIDRTSQSLSRLRNVLAGALSVREVQRFADTWTVAGNKVAAASEVAGRSGRSLSELNDIATETRSGITETVDLYAKLLRATKGVAESEEQVARATALVNKAFKAGGAAASEQAAGILQLAQGLSSGVLQGDELRSIRENAPLVAQAIADEFEVTIGGLKDLGASGELTAERVFQAILKGEQNIEAAFARTNATIGESFVLLRNALTQYVGEADASVGATEKLAGAMAFLAENIQIVVSAGGVLAGVFIGPVLTRGLAMAVTRLFAASTALAGLSAGATMTAVSMRALAGGLAILGGPIGALIAAVSLLPLVVETSGEKIAALLLASSQGASALDTYAAASRAAAGEQEGLAGQVSRATQEILAQSRAGLQSALTDLRAELEDVRAELDDGFVFNGEARIASQRLSGANNPALQELRDSLEALADGAEVDLSGLAQEMDRLAGAGAEVVEAVKDFNFDEQSEKARAQLVTLAQAIGGFEEELTALDAATGPLDVLAAYQSLNIALLDVAGAGRIVRTEQFEGLRALLSAAGATEDQVGLIEDALRANNGELQELVERANAGADAAAALAENAAAVDLSRAVAQAGALSRALRASSAQLSDLAKEAADLARRETDFDIKTSFSGDPAGLAGAKAAAEFDRSNPIGRGLPEADLARRNELRAQAIDLARREAVEMERLEAIKDGASTKPLFDISADEIARLELARATLGKTSAQIAGLTVRTALLNEAKARGLDLDQRSTSTGRTLREEIEKQAKAVEELTEKYDEAANRRAVFEDIIEDISSGIGDAFVEAIRGTENFGDAFRNMASDILADIAKMIIQQSIFNAIAQALGGPGSSGGVLEAFGLSLPKFANGTSSAPGGLSIVGERGPELVNLPKGAQVMPAPQTRDFMQGGPTTKAPTVTVNEAPIEVHHHLGDADFGSMLRRPGVRLVMSEIMAREGFNRG